MKKFVTFAAVMAAVSFTSCGNKSVENVESAETEVAVEEVVPTVEEAVEVNNDSTTVASSDTTVAATHATEAVATPAE